MKARRFLSLNRYPLNHSACCLFDIEPTMVGQTTLSACVTHSTSHPTFYIHLAYSTTMQRHYFTSWIAFAPLFIASFLQVVFSCSSALPRETGFVLQAVETKMLPIQDQCEIKQRVVFCANVLFLALFIVSPGLGIASLYLGASSVGWVTFLLAAWMLYRVSVWCRGESKLYREIVTLSAVTERPQSQMKDCYATELQGTINRGYDERMAGIIKQR
jgi:hypothetical protein